MTQLIGTGAVTCFKNIRDFRRGKITQQPNTTKFDPGIFRSLALELTTFSTVLLEKLIFAYFFENFTRFVTPEISLPLNYQLFLYVIEIPQFISHPYMIYCNIIFSSDYRLPK